MNKLLNFGTSSVTGDGVARYCMAKVERITKANIAFTFDSFAILFCAAFLFSRWIDYVAEDRLLFFRRRMQGACLHHSSVDVCSCGVLFPAFGVLGILFLFGIINSYYTICATASVAEPVSRRTARRYRDIIPRCPGEP